MLCMCACVYVCVCVCVWEQKLVIGPNAPIIRDVRTYLLAHVRWRIP
jgi:hypothetical protein